MSRHLLLRLSYLKPESTHRLTVDLLLVVSALALCICTAQAI